MTVPIPVGPRNHNPRVGGSSPSSATIFPNDYSAFAGCSEGRRWGGLRGSVNHYRLEADFRPPRVTRLLVFRWGADPKIRPAIVKCVAVDVVDVRVGWGVRDKSVDQHAPPSDGRGDIRSLSHHRAVVSGNTLPAVWGYPLKVRRVDQERITTSGFKFHTTKRLLSTLATPNVDLTMFISQIFSLPRYCGEPFNFGGQGEVFPIHPILLQQNYSSVNYCGAAS